MLDQSSESSKHTDDDAASPARHTRIPSAWRHDAPDFVPRMQQTPPEAHTGGEWAWSGAPLTFTNGGFQPSSVFTSPSMEGYYGAAPDAWSPLTPSGQVMSSDYYAMEYQPPPYDVSYWQPEIALDADWRHGLDPSFLSTHFLHERHEDSPARPRVSHQQLLQVVIYTKERLVEDIQSTTRAEGWVTSMRNLMRRACNADAQSSPGSAKGSVMGSAMSLAGGSVVGSAMGSVMGSAMGSAVGSAVSAAEGSEGAVSDRGAASAAELESPFSHPLAYWLTPPPRMRYVHPSIMDAALYALRNPKTGQDALRYELSARGEAGFENGLRGDWLIALIAFFYYTLPPLRLSVATHTCRESHCWACELALLFRSLDVGHTECHGQPVRIDKFCEALFRSAPTTLGLSKQETEPNFNPSVNCEDIRVSHQLRLAFASRGEMRPWLKARSQRRHKVHPLIDLDDKRRELVAKAVRRTEAEKGAERDQRQARFSLHNRCHQVLNYLLHAFGTIGSGSSSLFCIQVETETACRTTHKATRVPTPAYVLELDHSDWLRCSSHDAAKHDPAASASVADEAGAPAATGTESGAVSPQPQEMSSNPISTSHSFRWDGPPSRPSSGTSSSSEFSLSGEESSKTSSPFRSSHPLPPLAQKAPAQSQAGAGESHASSQRPDFARLLEASMCRTNTVQMVCNACENKTRSSVHTVTQKVQSLPPVLAIKVKLFADSKTLASPASRFWRSFHGTVPLRWWRRGWDMDRRVSTLYPRGRAQLGSLSSPPDDDLDISRVLGLWLKLHRKVQTGLRPRSKSALKLQALSETLRAVIEADVSPVPSRVYITHNDKATSPDKTWTVRDARDVERSDADPDRQADTSKVDNSQADDIKADDGKADNGKADNGKADNGKAEVYDLIGLIVSVNHVWSRSRRAMAWRIWTHDIAGRLGLPGAFAAPMDSEDRISRLFNRLEAEETTLEAPPNEDQLITFVRLPGVEKRWLLINGPIVTEASEEEARLFALPWKFPCALFFAKTDEIWQRSLLKRLPPKPPSLPPTSELFDDHNISQTPMALRRPPSYVPLSPEELQQIENGQLTVAMDAEHVVVDMVNKSPSSLLANYSHLALARLSLVRAHGDLNDGTPFFDPYIAFREEPMDYRTEFSGLYPGDLDLNGSRAHCLCTFKYVHSVMRFLVEKKCKFIGHDLFNDFRVMSLIVPNEQIIDTVMIFRRSLSSRFLSLKFLCHHVLQMGIQLYTHDSIEDAQAALALYRFYIEYVARHSPEDFQLHHVERIYKLGYQTNFKIQHITPELPSR